MSLVSALVVTVLGLVCAAGTVWWALRAERVYRAGPTRQRPAERGWWESAEWWPSLSDDERHWVLQNLADAGHPAAHATLHQAPAESESDGQRRIAPPR